MGCIQSSLASDSNVNAVFESEVAFDDDYSDNISFYKNKSIIKKKELYMKIDDSKICSWFSDYMKLLQTKLPNYILFSNKQNCVIDNFVNKIKLELNKSITLISNEKQFESFENCMKFNNFNKEIIDSVINELDKKEKYNNIQENYRIKKYLKYSNINIYKNSIKPCILYKKLKIKYDIYYIPLSIYNAVKTQTDIIKTIQILELLGCKELFINTEEKTQKSKEFINELNVGFITQKNGVVSKQYNEKNIQRNNSYEFIDKLFSDEDELLTYINLNSYIFMDNLDYITDIELRFLIRSRINSYLQEYSRSFTVKQLNSIEINTQVLVKKIYNNLGLKFKYNNESFKEISFKIDCIFFSLNEIIDTSSLPLDAIGFNIIKNKLFEKNTDIIKYIDKEPELNNTVIVTVNNNKFFGKIKSILDNHLFEIEMFNSENTVTSKRMDINLFEFNEESDNQKFIKEMKRFIQKILAYKFQKYKKYINQNKESYFNHRENYVSYFNHLSKIRIFSNLLEQIETYTDVKEIVCHVKYSGYFVYLNQSGFEKMKQYIGNLNDKELLEDNYMMFAKRYLFYNDINIKECNKIKEKHQFSIKSVQNFKQIDCFLNRIFNDWEFCPLTKSAVDYYFSSIDTKNDNKNNSKYLYLTHFLIRVIRHISIKKGKEIIFNDKIEQFIHSHVTGFVDTNHINLINYDFIENIYQMITENSELYNSDSTFFENSE